MIDWFTLFQNFGYPALITGVLLYILIYRVEKLTNEVTECKTELIKMTLALTEYRKDVEKFWERHEEKDQTRPRRPA